VVKNLVKIANTNPRKNIGKTYVDEIMPNLLTKVMDCRGMKASKAPRKTIPSFLASHINKNKGRAKKIYRNRVIPKNSQASGQANRIINMKMTKM